MGYEFGLGAKVRPIRAGRVEPEWQQLYDAAVMDGWIGVVIGQDYMGEINYYTISFFGLTDESSVLGFYEEELEKVED